MAFQDDLSTGRCGKKVEGQPKVSKVIYLGEAYNFKKITCGYVRDSVIGMVIVIFVFEFTAF